VVDLLVNDYRVLLDEGLYEDRFELLVSKSTTTGIAAQTNEHLVYSFDKGIYLVSKEDKMFDFVLYDALGREVKSQSYFSNGQRIDARELPSGVYFVKLLNQQGREQQITKIVLR
jgi:hypothetical protein